MQFGRFKCNTIRLKKGVSLNKLKQVLKYLNIEFASFEKYLYHDKNCHPRQKTIIQPNILNTEIAEMIGYLCGDGHVDSYHVTFFDENIKNLKHINSIIKRNFNITASIKKEKREKMRYLQHSSKTFVEYLRKIF